MTRCPPPVGQIEADPVGDYTKCRAVLAELGLAGVTDEDCSALRSICEVEWDSVTAPPCLAPP